MAEAGTMEGVETPVEEPVPLPYAVNVAGQKEPLPGVVSVFLTGTTVDIVALKELTEDLKTPQMKYVSKEKILKDIQFRGAISDFHPIKDKIQSADYDPLLFRSNVDDVYGDGNNFEVAFLQAAANAWQFIMEETARRAALAAEAAPAAEGGVTKPPPRVKHDWTARPWQTQGSEAEMEETSVHPTRPPIAMTAARRRREFSRPLHFSDKDAAELWNSSMMECRPFKDANFELRRLEFDAGVQAVPELTDREAQATGGRPRAGCSQYEPVDMPEAEKDALWAAPEMTAFLDAVSGRCLDALTMNSVCNIFGDDFAGLAEDDGASGNRKDNAISEYQSFVDLTFSKGKVISAIQWLPHRKGCVAVACTEPLSFNERVEVAGVPKTCAILIWNFKDPIHPQYVLEAPDEVFSFQFNPVQPEIVAAGCYNGQILLWDTTAEEERLASAKPSANANGQANKENSVPNSPATGIRPRPHPGSPGGSKGGGGPGGAGGGGGGGAVDMSHIPVVRHHYISLPEASHHAAVTDLHWLPEVTITREGKFVRAGAEEGAAGRECNLFVTTAANGKVLFWDVRVGRNRRKVKREDEELEWKPIYVVSLLGPEGGDLASQKLSFSLGKDDLKQHFFTSSFDGELVYADVSKPEGEEQSDGSIESRRPHCGAVRVLQRSPFFEDVLLTAGDWTFAIWREGAHDTPLFQSPNAASHYTAGSWSPTRPAVIYVARADGVLEVWDLLERSHEPTMLATPSSAEVSALSFSPPGPPPTANQRSVQQLLAVGDTLGVLHILDLPRNLRRRVPNEVKTMGTFLQREQARVEYVKAGAPARAKALKEQQEAQKKAEEEEKERQEKLAAAAEGQAPPQITPEQELDVKAEAAYRKMEKEFREKLGLPLVA